MTNMLHRIRPHPSLLLVLVVLLLVACGSAEPAAESPGEAATPPDDDGADATEPEDTPVEPEEPEEPEEEVELTSATLRLDYAVGGEHLPYYLGVEKGFFRDEGLDLEVQEGTGSGVTVTLVASRDADFGNANTPPFVFGVEEGIPVQMVANFSGGSGFGLIWIEGQGPEITHLEDLAGLRLGTIQGSGSAAVLPLVLSVAGLSADDLTIINTPPPAAIYTALLEDQIDVALGVDSMLPDFAQLAPDNTYRMFDLGDVGIEMMAHGLITHTDTVENDPDLVRSFVRGAQRSWAYVMEDPAHVDEAIELAAELFPGVESEPAREQLVDHIEGLRGELTAGQPLGWMDPDGWADTQRTIDALEEAPIERDVLEYYTNDFLDESILADDYLAAGG